MSCKVVELYIHPMYSIVGTKPSAKLLSCEYSRVLMRNISVATDKEPTMKLSACYQSDLSHSLSYISTADAARDQLLVLNRIYRSLLPQLILRKVLIMDPSHINDHGRIIFDYLL
jgi:hypothetical protein